MRYFLKFILALLVISNQSCQSTMTKSVYLVGSEAVFNGDPQSLRFLETQTVAEKVALANSEGIELVFEKGILVKKYQLMYEEKYELELKQQEIGFKLPFEPKPHPIYVIEKSETTSESYLGGEIPDGFTIPKFNRKPSFQFLGTLSNTTEGLEWLPFDLLLTVPLYGHFDPLFLDYSDPLSPKVINEEHYLSSDYDDEFVKHDSDLVYEKAFITTQPSDEIPEFEENIGIAGVPVWIQNPAIPVCPISGRTMKFVCQLNYGLDIPLKSSSFSTESGGAYIEKMNFGIDGDLYLFIEPETKVVCVIIQHT
ncbi:MAG: hypothetical protein ACI9ZX_000161 [Algoriphagus sp.]|jgi:hypothetical protein